jgi:hypothetical protein
MSNRLGLIIAVLVIAFIMTDVVRNDGATMLFLLRKFFDFVEWLAFWR